MALVEMVLSMRLKSLELHGYKSFATRTTFHFDSGITAMVGPNGSGKSNVADAIRWVLGEQSYATLRGKKTEDMIFSGSDERARLGMASATLVLDNHDGWLSLDFAEVTVTRRAFRDGQNEYLLNGSRVRLRDINELLAASGLSRRTYTHVGQGMVDAALSLRSEERRALFEEAAGITLHHAKRAETIAKLDATQANLLRLHDIVSEIEPRLRYLERQAERANTHRVISANLKDLLRIWYGYRWGLAHQQLREARQEETRGQAVLQTESSALDKIGACIAALRSRQSELRARLGEWHRQSSGLHIEAEALQRSLAVGEERARLLAAQHDEVLGEIELLDISRSETEAKAVAVQVALAQISAELAAARSRTDALHAEIDVQRVQRQRLLDQQAHADRRLRELSDRLAGHRARLAESHERRVQLTQEAAQADAAAAAHRQAQADLERQVQAKDAAIQQLQAEIARLQSSHNERLTAVQALEQLAGEQREEINTHRRRLDSLRARYDLLGRMQRDMVGYYEGVRSVLAAAAPAGQIHGILGSVSQLMRVPPHLDTAIETALGGHLQDIVVRTWRDAETAIAHLKSTHSGRATFLPLDTIRPPRTLTAPAVEKVLGIASELVDCDASLRPVAALLLGSTVVVEDLAVARRVHAALHGGFQIVTLAGDLVRSGGSVSGGSVGRDRVGGGFLAREREWQELPVAIETQQAAEQALLRRLEKTRTTTAEAQAVVDELARRYAVLEAERAALDRERTALVREAERAEQAVAWHQSLVARAQAACDDVDQTARHLTAEVEEIEAEQAAARTEADRLAELAATLTAEALLTELNQAQAALAAVEGRAGSQKAILAGHTGALAEIEVRLNARRNRAAGLEGEGAALAIRLAEQRTQTLALTDQIAALRDLIAPAEQELSRLEKEQATQEDQERQQRERLHRLETDHSRIILELNRRQDEIALLQRQIEDDLGLVELDLSEAAVGQPPLPLHPLISQLPVVEELPDDLESDIRRLRVQLSQLGSVNLNAPQEFEEVRTRHAFLQNQINDLEQASNHLRQIITELDQLMESSFLSTFHAVAREFKTYFKRLFNGGDADLVLTAPDNITQTGIDVIARPPGKRAQALAMLSGGERALTAASLIFALLRVSPTPFCTLDEVDAMLDEANVGRFRDVLVDLAEQTQFIVITHNRHTVEAARTIYGISMGEDTVSRVISLQLDDVSAHGVADNGGQ
jgi:chromosome segregation protein